MKKIILTYLSLLMTTSLAYGDGVPSYFSLAPVCGITADLFPASFNMFFEDKNCIAMKDEAQYCKCLTEQKDNIFKKIVNDDSKSVKELAQQQLLKNKERLFKIYSNLNYEVAFQEQVYNMVPANQQTGCTSVQMANAFKDALCKDQPNSKDCVEASGDEYIGTSTESELSLDHCPNNDCSAVIAKINSLYKEEEEEVHDQEDLPMAPTNIGDQEIALPNGGQSLAFNSSSTISQLPSPKGSDNFMSSLFTKSVNTICTRKPDDVNKTPAQIKQEKEEEQAMLWNLLKPAYDFFMSSKYAGLMTDEKMKELKELRKEIENGEGLECGSSSIKSKANRFLAEYHAKSKYSQKATSANRDVPKSIEMAQLQNEFAINDKAIKDKLAAGYQQSIPGACIDYNKFKVYNSIPSKELMAGWASMSVDEIDKALDPKNMSDLTSNYPTKFLQTNPTIAKNVVNPGQRKLLAEKLKSFASKNKDKKDQNAVLKNYMDFMKTDIAELNKQNKMVDLLQCDLLAQNFAALASSDELPALDIHKSDDTLGDYNNNVMACKIRAANKRRDRYSPLNDILAANDLFTIFESNPNAGQGPEKDEDYKQFLAKNCPDFEEFAKQDFRTSCLVTLNRTKCEKKAYNTESSKHKRLLDRYYAKNPLAKQINETIEQNTEKFSKEEMFQKSSSTSQDAVARKSYDTYVRPTVMKRSIYSTQNIFNPSSSSSSSSDPDKKSLASAGQSINEAMNKGQEVYNNGGVPNPSAPPMAFAQPVNSQSSSPEQGSPVNNQQSSVSSNSISVPQPTFSQSSPTSQSVANPGQVIPSFLNENPNSDAENHNKISSLEDVKDAMEELEGLPKEQQGDLLEQTKDYLDSQDQSNKEIAKLQKKLDKLEDEKGLGNSSGSAGVSGMGKFGSNSLGSSLGSTNRSPASIGSSNSSAGSNSISSSSAESKAAKSYKRALNQMNDKDGSFQEKVVVNGETDFVINGTPISKNEIPGSLVVGKPLEPSSEMFNKISSDPNALKDYLASNLKEVPDNNIISIKCKGRSCASDKNEIFLYVSRVGGKVSIRSISSDTKITRSNTLKSLKLNLQQ